MAVRQVYFLSETEEKSNLCNTTLPIVINCTGTEFFYAPFKKHSYRYDYSFVYILKGKLNFNIDGKKYTLKTGEFMVIPPRRHNEYQTEDSFLNYYWIQFTGNKIFSLLSEININTEEIYSSGITSELKGIIDDINREFMINDKLFSLMSASKLIEFFSILSRNVHNTREALLESVKYIHNNYHKNISVSFLAATEHLSVSYYRSIFSKKYGLSPKQYIMRLRLNMVCHYLTKSEYSFSEIAAKTGFTDPLYLSRVFHKKIGVSMSQYRKNGI